MLYSNDFFYPEYRWVFFCPKCKLLVLSDQKELDGVQQLVRQLYPCSLRKPKKKFRKTFSKNIFRASKIFGKKNHLFQNLNFSNQFFFKIEKIHVFSSTFHFLNSYGHAVYENKRKFEKKFSGKYFSSDQKFQNLHFLKIQFFIGPYQNLTFHFCI